MVVTVPFGDVIETESDLNSDVAPLEQDPTLPVYVMLTEDVSLVSTVCLVGAAVKSVVHFMVYAKLDWPVGVNEISTNTKSAIIPILIIVFKTLIDR